MQFKKGDTVKIKDTPNIAEYNAEESIGKTFILDDYNAKRLNGGINIHPFDNKYSCNYDSGDLEIINRETISKDKSIKKTTVKKEKILLNIERRKGKLALYVKIPQRLEEYFKQASAESPKQSAVWKDKKGIGAKFYVLIQDYQDLEAKLQYAVFNDYGQGLLKADRINLAPLRTVGASEGVYIFSDNFQAIDNVNYEYYIRQLGLCTKSIWEQIIRDRKVKAIISFEID